MMPVMCHIIFLDFNNFFGTKAIQSAADIAEIFIGKMELRHRAREIHIIFDTKE